MSSKKKDNVARKRDNEEVYDVNDTLKKVKKLRETQAEDEEARSSTVAKVEAGLTEVLELPCESVADRIEELVVSVVMQILTGNKGFELAIPNRAATNQLYIEEIDRIVLGNKMSKRQFLNTAHVRKTAITTRYIIIIIFYNYIIFIFIVIIEYYNLYTRYYKKGFILLNVICFILMLNYSKNKMNQMLS